MMRCPSDGIFPLQLMRCLQRCSQLLVFQLIMSSALTAHQNTPKALAANRGSAKGPAAPQMAVNVPFALPKFFCRPGEAWGSAAKPADFERGSGRSATELDVVSAAKWDIGGASRMVAVTASTSCP